MLLRILAPAACGPPAQQLALREDRSELGKPRERFRHSVSAARCMTRRRVCCRSESVPARATSVSPWGTLRVGSKSPDTNRVSIFGGPAVMECLEFRRLFRPVTLRRYLSVALPLSLNRGGLCPHGRASRCDTRLIIFWQCGDVSHFTAARFHNHRLRRESPGLLLVNLPAFELLLREVNSCLCNDKGALCYSRAKCRCDRRSADRPSRIADDRCRLEVTRCTSDHAPRCTRS